MKINIMKDNQDIKIQFSFQYFQGFTRCVYFININRY